MDRKARLSDAEKRKKAEKKKVSDKVRRKYPDGNLSRKFDVCSCICTVRGQYHQRIPYALCDEDNKRICKHNCCCDHCKYYHK